MKLGVSLNDELVERIDNYAERNYMSRSGAISVACSTYLNSQEIMFLVRDMSLAFQEIAKNGSIDDENMKQLEKLQITCDTLLRGQGK